MNERDGRGPGPGVMGLAFSAHHIHVSTCMKLGWTLLIILHPNRLLGSPGRQMCTKATPHIVRVACVNIQLCSTIAAMHGESLHVLMLHCLQQGLILVCH